MKQRDQNSINMWRVVINYLNSRTAVWDSNSLFAQAKGDLDAALREADASMQEQARNTTGITKAKEELEREAVREVMSVTKVARAFALHTGNRQLGDAIGFSKSYLLDMPDAALVAQLRAILQAVLPFRAELHDLGLDSLQPAIDATQAYAHSVADPRTAISERAAATDRIPRVIKSGRIALEKMDNLVHVFDGKTPGFSSGYKPCRVTVD